MNLKEYLAAARRYWLTFILTSGVIFALGLTWLLLSPAKFVSSTQLMVSIEGFTTAAAYENDQVVERRINSYIPLLTSGVVTQRVIDTLKLPLTSAELAAKINATNVPPRTSIIDIQVTDESPARAQLLAKALASEFVNYTEALETPTGGDSQKVRTTVVTAASEPREQGVERVLLGGVAGLAALVVGAVAVWIRSRTDPVVRTAEQAAVAGGVPVLGCISAATEASDDDLAAYRRLRARLQSITSRAGEPDTRGRVTVLTSTVGEVDTALIASRLGHVMESAGSHSVVLDTSIGEADSAPNQPLAETTSGNKHDPGSADDKDNSANDTNEPNDGARFGAAPAPKSAPAESEYGADKSPDASSESVRPTEPGQLVGEATPELIDHLRGEYEQILVAAAPVLSTNGAPSLTDFAEAVLLVLSIGETIQRDLSRTAEKLRTIGAPPSGSVLVGKYNSLPQFDGI